MTESDTQKLCDTAREAAIFYVCELGEPLLVLKALEEVRRSRDWCLDQEDPDTFFQNFVGIAYSDLFTFAMEQRGTYSHLVQVEPHFIGTLDTYVKYTLLNYFDSGEFDIKPLRELHRLHMILKAITYPYILSLKEEYERDNANN